MAKKKKKLNRTLLIRRLVQLAFALFIIVASVRHSVSSEHLPSTDAYCPFGMVETAWQFMTSGTFVQKTHPSNLVLGLGLLLGALLAGGAFCGWICPFGALNDLLTWIRTKLRLPELKVPARLDKILTFGRYVMLFLIPYMTITTATLWFSNYDPYRTIFSLGWLFEFNWAEHWPAYLIALGVILGGLFIPRFWCRYLCPQGVLIGLIQRISPVQVWRDPKLCTNCRVCDRVCPSKIPVPTLDVMRGDCISCLDCIEVCPKAGALSVAAGRPQFIFPVEEVA